MTTRRLATLLIAVAAAVILIVSLGSGSSTGASVPVDVFPYAGTPTANPKTTVSFRGQPASAITGVTVKGSQTGDHTGTMKEHSDGQGASFVPDKPFAEGETVTVHANLPLTGADASNNLTFQIARLPHPPPHDPPPSPDPGGHPKTEQVFKSEPKLRPPSVQVNTRTSAASKEYIFLGPKAGEGQDGVQILDARGRTVYFHEVPGSTSAFDVRSQTYEGKPVLTWWQGVVAFGKGYGFGLIYDNHYRRVAKVAAGNGYRIDLHEFQLTGRATALVNVYQPVQQDLSSSGGPSNALVFDSIVQEIDVKTGLVLYEWHSLGKVPVTESALPVKNVKPGGTFDYFHINSAQLQGDGSFLISARNTNAVYEIDQHTGNVHWTLGGKNSSFKMGDGTRTVGQHSARRLPNGDVAIFDNGAAAPPPAPIRPSRGLQVHLDLAAKTATLVHGFEHPKKLGTFSQGSSQTLANGNLFIGWGGSQPYFTEFDPSGKVVFDANFTVPSSKHANDSYRAWRLPWSGQPSARPKAVGRRGKSKTIVYASWNGATNVAKWQVLAGSSRKHLKAVRRSRWKGFETRIGAPRSARYIKVEALDSSGKVLSASLSRKVK